MVTADLSRALLASGRRGFWIDLRAARLSEVRHRSPHTFWWSPQGDRLLTASGEWVGVWRDPSAPPQVVFESEDDDPVLGANWSLDGARLWITLAGRVLEVDLAGGVPREVYRGAGRYYDPQPLAEGGVLVTEVLPEAPRAR